MTDNVIQFGKPKKPEPSKPVDGDMTGYQTARAISHHFGIAISNDDAIKLDRALRATVYHAMEQARAEEREACAQICATRAKDFHDLFLKYRHEEDAGATMGANQCEELIRARNGK